MKKVSAPKVVTALEASRVRRHRGSRELCGFRWAAMTHQPLRDEQEAAAA